MKNIYILFIVILVAIFAVSSSAFAQKKPNSLKGIEFLSAYSEGRLIDKDNYQLITLMVDFNFDLKPLTNKINFNPASILQFQFEPFFSFVNQPDTNLELGTSFLFKLGFLPEDLKLQPYLKGGLGIAYMTQHTLNQSTQYNFLPQIAGGLHYFFEEDVALTAEYRYRHLSNCSFKRPNHGIDSRFIIVGVSYSF